MDPVKIAAGAGAVAALLYHSRMTQRGKAEDGGFDKLGKRNTIEKLLDPLLFSMYQTDTLVAPGLALSVNADGGVDAYMLDGDKDVEDYLEEIEQFQVDNGLIDPAAPDESLTTDTTTTDTMATGTTTTTDTTTDTTTTGTMATGTTTSMTTTTGTTTTGTTTTTDTTTDTTTTDNTDTSTTDSNGPVLTGVENNAPATCRSRFLSGGMINITHSNWLRQRLLGRACDANCGQECVFQTATSGFYYDTQRSTPAWAEFSSSQDPHGCLDKVWMMRDQAAKCQDVEGVTDACEDGACEGWYWLVSGSMEKPGEEGAAASRRVLSVNRDGKMWHTGEDTGEAVGTKYVHIGTDGGKQNECAAIFWNAGHWPHAGTRSPEGRQNVGKHWVGLPSGKDGWPHYMMPGLMWTEATASDVGFQLWRTYKFRRGPWKGKYLICNGDGQVLAWSPTTHGWLMPHHRNVIKNVCSVLLNNAHTDTLPEGDEDGIISDVLVSRQCIWRIRNHEGGVSIASEDDTLYLAPRMLWGGGVKETWTRAPNDPHACMIPKSEWAPMAQRKECLWQFKHRAGANPLTQDYMEDSMPWFDTDLSTTPFDRDQLKVHLEEIGGTAPSFTTQDDGPRKSVSIT